MNLKFQKPGELTKLKQKYFFAVIGVYLSFFLISFMILSIVLTILQAHPYMFLATALILMLGDILFTERTINQTLKEYWIRK